MPRLTVITVVKNAAHTIADCIASVQHQSAPAEHILIDARSADGTSEIIRELAPNARHIREPDAGAYDAMNKGIRLATAEVIGILNADDFYASPTVLAAVSALFADPALDSCYGDVKYVWSPTETSHPTPTASIPHQPQLVREATEFHLPDERVRRTWRAGPFHPRSFLRGWMPPHPTFFVRAETYRRLGGFSLNLGTAADYELMLRFLHKHRITTRYLPATLVKMRVGGASNVSLKNRLAAHRMDRLAWTVNNLRPNPWTLAFKPLRKLSQWLH